MFKPQPLPTLYAARILGPLMIATGAALISQRDRMLLILGDFLDSDALTLLAGFISLSFGLVLITLHDRWRGFTQVVITLIGWLSVIRGAVLLFAPAIAHEATTRLLAFPQLIPILGCVMAFLGLWLALVGFITPTAVVEAEPEAPPQTLN